MAAALVLVLAGALIWEAWTLASFDRANLKLHCRLSRATDMAAADAAKGYELQSSPGAPADSVPIIGDVGFRGRRKLIHPGSRG